MDNEANLMKILEAINLVTKIAEIRNMFSAYSNTILNAPIGESPNERRLAILSAIRPYMDEEKQRRLDIIAKFIELNMLMGDCRPMFSMSAKTLEVENVE